MQQCYFNFEWYATGNNAKPGDLLYLSLMCLSLFHQGTHNLCKTACWHWVHNNHPHQNCSQLYSTDHRKVHLQPNQDDYILFKNLFVFIIYFLFVDFFPKRKTKFLKKSRNRKKTSRTSRKSNKIEGYGNRSQKRKVISKYK